MHVEAVIAEKGKRCYLTVHIMPPSDELGDATLREALDRLEKKYGIEAAKQEYARRASTGVSALNGGMVARTQAEVTGRSAVSQSRGTLEAMTLRQRRDALDKHYAARESWIQARSRKPTPKEFLAWLDKNFPDRREIGMVLSDLKYLDDKVAAYKKVQDWLQSDPRISRATIDAFGLPSKVTKYDPVRDATAPKLWSEVFARTERGEDSFKNLRRAFGRVRYHTPAR